MICESCGEEYEFDEGTETLCRECHELKHGCDACEGTGRVEDTCYCDGGDRYGYGRCPTCKGVGVVFGFCDCAKGQKLKAEEWSALSR